ncbi:MAG: hypothetical protein AAF226_04585 [Verrucomicrobiota bacterium]
MMKRWTRIDKIFMVTVGVILLSIPAIFLIRTSTPKQVATVRVLERKFVELSYEAYPLSAASRYGGSNNAPVPVPAHWKIEVPIDNVTTSISLPIKEKELAHASHLKIKYQYLRDGSLRIIRVSMP